ncbi:hypothetical protein KVP10_03300 [Candidimonas humi]|uniref:SCP2 domain-containing protein n=1 Tax=Candidimonas humi TaxID=683355 RepID=A0ABV8P4D4_9BURK|nr:hypothetical protein [Candidimonas humi]MBV6303896.1 hypothetical protein [Candidimonas humi]
MISEDDILRHLPERFNSRAWTVQYARHLRTRFMLGVGNKLFRIAIAEGRIVSIERGPFLMNEWDFSLEAEEETWQKFWLAVPPPGFHDVMALSKTKRLAIRGNIYPFMSNLLYFKALLSAVRGLGETTE